MADQKTDAEKQAEEVAEKGRFEALENGDNTIEVSNDAYLGVDAQYQNYANETDKPVATSGDSDEAKAAKEQEERAKGWVFNDDPDAAKRNPRTGYVTEVKHPSEPRDTAVDKQIEAERRARAGGSVAPRQAQPETAGRKAPAKD